MSSTDLRLDPVTFEVLRHKLDEIVAEAYHTIGRVSGSPVVYEGGDHQEAICSAAGDLVAFGSGALHWVRSISEGVRHVSTELAENPGFDDGDQFLVNDSYMASVHASDVQLLSPIFAEGRLIAWAGTSSHQQDTGGVNPGGHHVDAKDVYAEGFQTRGLKLVEKGVVRRDVEETFANMVRQPELGLLDLRAKMASNNVMRERLLALVDRYGADTVVALFEQLIEYSETRLRGRLAELADGSWTATSRIEGMVEPELSVQVTLTKRGEELSYDLTGTSPQSVAAENIAPPGAQACVISPLIVSLCHDLPWNEGLFRPLEFILPEGSLVNPVRPAPVSANIPSGACVLVPTASQTVTAELLLTSEEFSPEAAAGLGGSFNYPVFAGLDRAGASFATLALDGLAGGSGAMLDTDGDSSGHNAWGVKAMIPNVETTELIYPLLYLWRSETPDSSGAGRTRGGSGINAAFMAWKVPELVAVTVGVGVQSRAAPGLRGGYPGANAPIAVARAADPLAGAGHSGRLPESVAELGGSLERIAPKGMTELAASDVLVAYVASGGGGLGDPLEREPRLVVEDLARGIIGAAVAAEVYGVVLDPSGRVDDAATRREREEAKEARIKQGRLAAVPPGMGLPMCTECREGAGVLSFDAGIESGEAPALAPEDPLFALRHSCCESCGRLLDVRVVPRGSASVPV
jgi:N-methylhydantoinase B